MMITDNVRCGKLIVYVAAIFAIVFLTSCGSLPQDRGYEKEIVEETFAGNIEKYTLAAEVLCKYVDYYEKVYNEEYVYIAMITKPDWKEKCKYAEYCTESEWQAVIAAYELLLPESITYLCLSTGVGFHPPFMDAIVIDFTFNVKNEEKSRVESHHYFYIHTFEGELSAALTEGLIKEKLNRYLDPHNRAFLSNARDIIYKTDYEHWYFGIFQKEYFY